MELLRLQALDMMNWLRKLKGNEGKMAKNHANQFMMIQVHRSRTLRCASTEEPVDRACRRRQT